MIEALYLALTFGASVPAASDGSLFPPHETSAHSLLAEPKPSQLRRGSSSQRTPPEGEIRQDEWVGNDKLRHFLMSMAVTQFAYGGLRTADTKDDVALPIAIGVAAIVGVGKEVHDVRNERPFSLSDLAWDAAGIVAAGVLLGSVR